MLIFYNISIFVSQSFEKNKDNIFNKILFLAKTFWKNCKNDYICAMSYNINN